MVVLIVRIFIPIKGILFTTKDAVMQVKHLWAYILLLISLSYNDHLNPCRFPTYSMWFWKS